MSSKESSVGLVLREVARLYTRAQRVEAGRCKTTSTQCLILTELARTGEQPMTELGQRLLFEKSWVSRAVDGLVDLGAVAKRVNPEDSRSWLVGLTAAGKKRVRELEGALDVHANELFAALAPADRESTKRSLALLLNVLRSDSSATCCLPAAERKESTCN